MNDETRKDVKKHLKDAIERLSGWVVSQLITLKVDPRLGLLASAIFTSVYFIRKLGIIVQNIKVENLLESIEDQLIAIIIDLELTDSEIERCRKQLNEEKSASKRESLLRKIEDEIRRKEVLEGYRAYFEALLGSIRIIETYGHIHGNKINEILMKVIELSEKALQRRIDEEEIKKVLDELDELSKIPELPEILRLYVKNIEVEYTRSA